MQSITDKACEMFDEEEVKDIGDSTLKQLFNCHELGMAIAMDSEWTFEQHCWALRRLQKQVEQLVNRELRSAMLEVVERIEKEVDEEIVMGCDGHCYDNIKQIILNLKQYE